MTVQRLETFDNVNKKVIGGFTHDGKTLKPETPTDAEIAAQVARIRGRSVHDRSVFDELNGYGNGYYVIRKPNDPVQGKKLPGDHPVFKTRTRTS
jgi:hypothetical protein